MYSFYPFPKVSLNEVLPYIIWLVCAKKKKNISIFSIFYEQAIVFYAFFCR